VKGKGSLAYLVTLTARPLCGHLATLVSWAGGRRLLLPEPGIMPLTPPHRSDLQSGDNSSQSIKYCYTMILYLHITSIRYSSSQTDSPAVSVIISFFTRVKGVIFTDCKK
jgi:hypothetical protein